MNNLRIARYYKIREDYRKTWNRWLLILLLFLQEKLCVIIIIISVGSVLDKTVEVSNECRVWTVIIFYRCRV